MKDFLLTDNTLITVPEYKASLSEINSFCSILSEMGVDAIELNEDMAYLVPYLPKKLKYYVKISSPGEIDFYSDYGADMFIWPLNIKKLCAAHIRKYKQLQILIHISSVHELNSVYQKLKTRTDILSHPIKIIGLDDILIHDWEDCFRTIRQIFGEDTELCPRNEYTTATATALEWIMAGGQSVTCAFGGGVQQKFAATEEVLMASKILLDCKKKASLMRMPKLRSLFKRLTEIDISPFKSVAGKLIFTYESGIHADGIAKNPSTYEPFEPQSVGNTRQLVIGKHSGAKALKMKLSQMGQQVDGSLIHLMLTAVRQESIRNKRSLYDFELLEILKQNRMMVNDSC